MQRNALRFRYGILAADATVVIVAMFLAIGMREGFPRSVPAVSAYMPILLCSLVVWTVVSTYTGLNSMRGGWHWSKVCSEVFVAVSITSVCVAATAYMLRDYLPRLLLVYFVTMLLLGLAAVRAGVHSQRSIGWRRPNRRVVIVGFGRVAQELAQKLQRHPEMRCEVVGFMTPSQMQGGGGMRDSAPDISVSPLDAMKLMAAKGITDIVVAFSGQPMPGGLSSFVDQSRAAGLRVSLVPYLYELYTSRASLLDVEGLPLVVLDDTCPNWWASLAKQIFDVCVASLAAPFALCVLLPAALYLRLVRVRALASETRCGKDGRPFELYRLCIDRSHADLRAFERVLDRLSITELPQLWNVIKGDMSIVGPRPESLERVRQYSDWQRQRLTVKPGLTGLAQVHGLRDHNSSEEKAAFDLQYLASWNLLTDIVLIIQTIWTLGARAIPGEPPGHDRRKKGLSRKAGLSSC